MSSPPTPDEFLSDPRFHRTFDFTLPPTDTHPTPLPFRISYADFGYTPSLSDTNANTVKNLLIFGPLCASRLLHLTKSRLASHHRLRLIHPDRPGFGATTPLPPAQRLPLWREAVAALLRHLGVAQVALAAHSGGTVYAVDFALHFAEFLSPPRACGVLAIAAPWVLPVHSGVALLGMAQALPVGVLRWTDWTARMVNERVGPVVGRVVGSLGGLGGRKEEERGEGEDEKFEKGVWKTVINRVYAEGVEGMSDEAVLLLQKYADDGWSDWGDYDVAIPRLVEVLRERGMELRVDVYYAAKDTLIGGPNGKGPEWFTQCWEKSSSDGVIEFYRHEVEGVDHDSIWSCGSRVVTEVFERLSASDKALQEDS